MKVNLVCPRVPTVPAQNINDWIKLRVWWGGGVVLCAVKTGSVLLMCSFLGMVQTGKRAVN